MAPFGVGVESSSVEELLVLTVLGRAAYAHAEVALHLAEPWWRSCEPDSGFIGVWVHWYTAGMAAVLTFMLETGRMSSDRGGVTLV